MNCKRLKYKYLGFLILLIITSSFLACNKKDNSSEVKVSNWDNTKYEAWESSVGLNVFNENSNMELQGKTNKENSVLYISDLNKPITLKFNNNGKNRNFIMTVYYDYVQIPFKITAKNDYSNYYKFDLQDSYEIELPMFLPKDLDMTGTHKLLISYSIGHDIHAKDIEEQSDWYGINTVYDVTYDMNDINFNENTYIYEKPLHHIDQTYPFTLNEDFDYSIIKTNIMPPVNHMVNVKKGNKFPLIYNLSTNGSDTEKLLMLVTLGFQQVKIDDLSYKLLDITKGTTGIGTIELTAPHEVGLYEVIALAVYNPFEKINVDKDFIVDSCVRFTLNVTE